MGAPGQPRGWLWHHDARWPGQVLLGLRSLPLNPQCLFPPLTVRQQGGLMALPGFFSFLLFFSELINLIGPCTFGPVLEPAPCRTQTDTSVGLKEYFPSPKLL